MNHASFAVGQMMSGFAAVSAGMFVLATGSYLGVILVALGALSLGFAIQNWIDYTIKAKAKVDGYQRMVDEERYKAEVGK